MDKSITIDYKDYQYYLDQIERLNNKLIKNKKEITELKNEIDFLKSKGENILVIVKNDNGDLIEYKNDEKNLLFQMVDEHKKMRQKNEELMSNNHKINLDNVDLKLKLDEKIQHIDLLIDDINKIKNKKIFKIFLKNIDLNINKI